MIKPIATLHTCYPEKFGVPRQSGLVPSAWGVVEFIPEWKRADAVRGLEQFSHLWLITQFHLVDPELIKPTVRPPRLGGNERRGVFATRSPFRPNRLALSVVKLERVNHDHPDSPLLYVSGVDLVNGTPVYDIKPYVPYADSVPDACGSFASEAPEPVEVRWQVDPPQKQDEAVAVIEDSIALLPQPAYHEEPGRVYRASLAGFAVAWVMQENAACITECRPLT